MSKESVKSKRGRKSLYRDEYATIAKFMCDRGATDQEIADCLGINERTINRWKKDYPEFCQSLKKGKEYFDNEIERALAERAMGYKHTDTKIFCSDGEIITHEYDKHYPPDVTACIYWLNNRKRGEWASRKAVESEIAVKDLPEGTGAMVLPAPANADDWLSMAKDAEKNLQKAKDEFMKHG